MPHRSWPTFALGGLGLGNPIICGMRIGAVDTEPMQAVQPIRFGPIGTVRRDAGPLIAAGQEAHMVVGIGAGSTVSSGRSVNGRGSKGEGALAYHLCIGPIGSLTVWPHLNGATDTPIGSHDKFGGRLMSPRPLFPLDCAGGFRRDVVDNAVDTFDLVDDARRDPAEHLVWKREIIGGHAIG